MGMIFPGVALPCKQAEFKWIIIRYGSVFTCAQVRDLGPWTEDDTEYVFGDARPRAELGKGAPILKRISDPNSWCIYKGKKVSSNGAGIDLFAGTAALLGIPLNESVEVEWKFVEL